jgi:hypothetical protein
MAIPLGTDGFAAGFRPADDAAIAAFMREWGFVVIKGFLGAQQCAATLSDCFEVLDGAANSTLKASRGSHRTPSHPVEDPLDPLHIGKATSETRPH